MGRHITRCSQRHRDVIRVVTDRRCPPVSGNLSLIPVTVGVRPTERDVPFGAIRNKERYRPYLVIGAKLCVHPVPHGAVGTRDSRRGPHPLPVRIES
jgi:hypothetical protein